MVLTRDNLFSNIDALIKEAVAYFWNTRAGQIDRQYQNQTHDQGNRGAVTGGKQLDGFVELVKQVLLVYGLPESYIYTNSALELPGYYRPNKRWDLLAVYNGRLLAAIEFKSQVGPSFGNNFNNRTEEAMGSALDLWTAYREGVLGTYPAPWLGYVMVLEDCEKSSVPVTATSKHFEIMREFVNASYKERYEIFCQKLMLERQYSATCLITTQKSFENPCNYSSPIDALSFSSFIVSLTGHIDAALRSNV